ncbi:MAG: hypothetical protein ACOYJD_00860 [Christensenellales bacterium]|jgi:hypothetical protein
MKYAGGQKSIIKENTAARGGFAYSVCGCCGIAALNGGGAIYTCPFCAEGSLENAGEPKAIPEFYAPFEIGREEAEKKFLSWSRGKLWAPEAMRKGASPLKKAYIPFWIFDAQADADYSVNVASYDKRAARGSNPPRMKWKKKGGRFAKYFERVPAAATYILSNEIMEGILPFDTLKLRSCAKEGIDGVAAACAIDEAKALSKAEAEMEAALRTDIIDFHLSMPGCDAADIEHVSADYNTAKGQLALLPVWMTSYTYRGNTYRYIMNGQSGKAVGQWPFSRAKAVIATALILAGAAVLALLI